MTMKETNEEKELSGQSACEPEFNLQVTFKAGLVWQQQPLVILMLRRQRQAEPWGWALTGRPT